MDKPPPPLPKHPAVASNPIRFASFYGKAEGAFALAGSNSHMRYLHDAQQQAADWMNLNPGIEIITIKTIPHEFYVAVTVWFRNGA